MTVSCKPFVSSNCENVLTSFGPGIEGAKPEKGG
jgi:hypothetical protein